jgi:hypothetical protein
VLSFALDDELTAGVPIIIILSDDDAIAVEYLPFMLPVPSSLELHAKRKLCELNHGSSMFSS